MASNVKKIGVLTSGGDSPGMNAAVRSVVRTALYNKMEVMAVSQGYSGLLNSDFSKMIKRDVSNILGLGGTILRSARCPEFKDPKNVLKAVENCRAEGIEGLVVIGGDGSYRGAKDLSNAGLPCIGIPGTIDNDIVSTDYTIGFDTALNTIKDCIDKLRDTSQSHNRCSVVEVMGKNCGDLALQSAISCGAVSVLVPEIAFSIDRDIILPMHETISLGKKHFIVIVAEGVIFNKKEESKHYSSDYIATYIREKTGVESRSTVLGHLQRGGSPTSSDRMLAAVFGNRAVNLLKDGKGNRVVGIVDNKFIDFDINEALEMEKIIDLDMVRIAREISL